MRMFRSSVLGAALLALVVLGACGGPGGDEPSGSDEPAGGGDKPTVTVGSDNFAEAQIVGEMYAQVLENAGYTVKRKLTLESREVRLPAMKDGQIDIAPEYVNTLLTVLDEKNKALTNPKLAGDAEALKEILNPILAKTLGLELLEPSNVIDANALVVTKDFSQSEEVTAVSDLAPIGQDLTLGGPPECPERPLCIPGYKRVYGIEFGDFESLEYGATITALEGDEIDVGLLFSTDGTIADKGFVLLEDDKNLQAADNITPLVRSEILTPEIEELLDSVSAALETDAITDLNKRANVDVEDPADLAEEYLTEKGLL